jgi:hypothetical protein
MKMKISNKSHKKSQISKAKVQMSNPIQSSNAKKLLVLNLELHLTFACLPVGGHFDI